MKRFLIFDFSLIPLIIAASTFMILESGEYYSSFYHNNLFKGYWSATLMELFLTTFTFLYFKKSPGLNFTIKLIIVILFVVMIGGASLKIISPLLTELKTTENNTKLIDFLIIENQQSKTNLLLLKGQRINTAIQAKHQRGMTKELISSLKKETKNINLIWTTIIFTTLLRFTIQLANLIMAHIVGKLYRDCFRPKRKYTKKQKEVITKLLKLAKRYVNKTFQLY